MWASLDTDNSISTFQVRKLMPQRSVSCPDKWYRKSEWKLSQIQVFDGEYIVLVYVRGSLTCISWPLDTMTHMLKYMSADLKASHSRDNSFRNHLLSLTKCH